MNEPTRVGRPPISEGAEKLIAETLQLAAAAGRLHADSNLSVNNCVPPAVVLAYVHWPGGERYLDRKAIYEGQFIAHRQCRRCVYDRIRIIEAELLHVAEQDGRLMLWALVDRNAPPCGRHIVVLPSDQAVEWPKPAKHVGTVPHFHGWMVFHVFDLGEVELAPRPVA